MVIEVDLQEFVDEFATGFQLADRRRPQAVSTRSGRQYQPGIGPHAEDAAVTLVLQELRSAGSDGFRIARPVPYPTGKQRCDLGIGDPLVWAVEVKMARAFGDNGKLDDTYLKDLLSPYPADHSALADSIRLRQSGFPCRRAVLVYGLDYSTRPLEPALNALEELMRAEGEIGARREAGFRNLVHPVHREGRIVAWEIL